MSDSIVTVHFEQKRSQGGYHHCWIPISQCKVITKLPANRDGTREARLELPTWLAEAKDLEVL